MKKPNEHQIQLLELDSLTPHPGYQRTANRQHIGRIIAVFDESLVGVLMVSPRETGGYWIWDGNHRLEVLTAMGYTHWHCMVSVISPVEQSLSFQTINDNVLRVSPIQKHTAALFRDEPQALELENALYQAGCHVGTSGSGNVSAVSACYTVIKRYGADNLTRALDILNGAWDDDKTARSAALIGGVANLIYAYPKLTNKQVVTVLSKYPTGGTFTGLAQAEYAASGGSKGFNQFRLIKKKLNINGVKMHTKVA